MCRFNLLEEMRRGIGGRKGIGATKRQEIKVHSRPAKVKDVRERNGLRSDQSGGDSEMVRYGLSMDSEMRTKGSEMSSQSKSKRGQKVGRGGD
jgi:hypothetical protein